MSVLISDWLCTLRWVRDHLAPFGWDPGRVAIAGKPAGGGVVPTLLGMPAAHGVHSRGIDPLQHGPRRNRRDWLAASQDARAPRQRTCLDAVAVAFIAGGDPGWNSYVRDNTATMVYDYPRSAPMQDG